ncbi:MAG TPA: ABC transporter permease [Fimbriimonadaceae bacterium]|nr:ABC transporter permease [Fimbriimonadaceae bacterium]
MNSANIYTNSRAAIRSLLEQWQRAVLSSLGITVGSTAIILLISIATGVQQDVSRQVSDLGVNLLIVLPGRIDEGSMFNASMIGISYLSEADADRIESIPGVKGAVPISFVGGGIRYRENRSPSTLVLATEPEWFQMRNMKLAEGRLFDNSDVNRPVCVVGGVANKKLFPKGGGLGRSIDYNGELFQVLGITADVAAENSLLSMGSFENVMYIPLTYAKKKEPKLQINRIMVQVDPSVEPKRLLHSVELLLGKRLDRESYSVLTQEDLLNLVFKIMGILTWLLTGLTSIALFVGGVGIMTVMLMSVNERAKEIGIRKTVGASRKDIFQQFLMEAVVLAIVGGATGLLLSYVACVALVWWTPIKPLMTLQIVALSFTVCLSVGAGFGLLPAMRAASKHPVEAIRHE